MIRICSRSRHNRISPETFFPLLKVSLHRLAIVQDVFFDGGEFLLLLPDDLFKIRVRTPAAIFRLAVLRT